LCQEIIFLWQCYGSAKALPSLSASLAAIHEITIVDSGDHHHSFVGGAPSGSAKDSYVWVKFTVNTNAKEVS
jgi:hypothetical protein